MARPNVDPIAQPRLNSIASPVGSFVIPNEGSGLRQLAESLGDLSPTLLRMAQRNAEDAKRKGEMDAASIYEDIKKTGQKIKADEIAPHESKWYRAAAREQVGRLAAAAYGQDLQLALASDEAMKDSTRPEDFDAFEAQFREQWMGEHTEGADKAFHAGFSSTAAGGILNARQSFIAAAANRLDGRVIDNTYAEHQVTIKDGLTSGMSVEEIAQRIKTRNSALYLANPKIGKALNRTTIEAVFDAARAYEDPDLLKILDNIEGGVPGSTLGQTKEALSKRSEVEREIRVNRQNRLAAEDKDAKRVREAAVGQVYDDMFAALETDPTTDPHQFAEKMAGIDKNEIPKLYRIAKAFGKQANADDEAVAHGLYERAFENDLSNEDVATAFSEGKITVKTAKSLRAQIKAGRGGRGSKALIQDPTYLAAVRDLNGLFIKHMGETPGVAGVFAEQQLRREWVIFRQSQEGATISEQQANDWLQGAVMRNFARFATGGDHEELRALVKATPKPDTPTFGPQMNKWETEPVVDRSYILDQIAAEYREVVAGKRSTFSPAAKEVLQRNGIAKGADVLRFIEAQRAALSLSGNPDRLR